MWGDDMEARILGAEDLPQHMSSVRLLIFSSILRTGSDVLSHELEPNHDGCAPAGSASINLIQIGRTLRLL